VIGNMADGGMESRRESLRIDTNFIWSVMGRWRCNWKSFIKRAI